MEQKRVATKQYKYSPSRVVFASPLQLAKHWYSWWHTQLAGMQFQSIFCNKEEKSTIIRPQIHTSSILLFFSVVYSRGPTHPSIMHKNLHKFTVFVNVLQQNQKHPQISQVLSNEHRLHGCMYTLSYFCGVGPLSSIFSLVEPSQGRITLGSQ